MGDEGWMGGSSGEDRGSMTNTFSTVEWGRLSIGADCWCRLTMIPVLSGQCNAGTRANSKLLDCRW
jgi:hypothetical protein